MPHALVHLASGIGNIVLASPLLLALEELGFVTDLRLDADYPETASLLENWSAVRQILTGAERPDWNVYDRIIPAIPPFYWSRFRGWYSGIRRVVARPQDRQFYSNEQDYYLAFARALGCEFRSSFPMLPIGPDERWGIGAGTVVLAPGCKTGAMAAKRWPYFVELARRIPEVAIVGIPDDLAATDNYPSHARVFVGQISLRQTAELIASAGLVVANDSGLAHLSAAVGTPTLMLFGPTPSGTLGAFPPHVTVLSRGMQCQPCWFSAPLAACAGRIDCLKDLSVDEVEKQVGKLRASSQ